MHARRVPAINYQALAAFRYALRRFLQFSEQAARDAGLEPQQHQLLLAIKGIPPGETSTIGFLAERLLIQHHSAVEIVDRAERCGLVRRGRPLADRRMVVVELAGKGARVIRKLSAGHLTELRTARAQLLKALRELDVSSGVQRKTGERMMRK